MVLEASLFPLIHDLGCLWICTELWNDPSVPCPLSRAGDVIDPEGKAECKLVSLLFVTQVSVRLPGPEDLRV